jgi:hypothetical protein
MNIQEQLFYAVINCDCRLVKELVNQGADVNHFFCYTKFDRFYGSFHVVVNIGHISYLMLAIQYVRILYRDIDELQYGKKLQLSDWMSLVGKTTSFKRYDTNEVTKLLALLVSLGADLNQESNCKYNNTFTSPIELLLYRYVGGYSYSEDDLAAVIKTNKVNLYSKHCQKVFEPIFDKNSRNKGFSVIIKALVLAGYKADYSAVKYHEFIMNLPKYFLFYCIECRNIFAFFC